MKIEQWKISDIIPYENNPRHNEISVDKVAMSLEQYGWQQPIVVDGDGVVIAGHTRLKAAVKLGMDKCPVVVADKLTPAQVKAYRIADNRTGELAEWDFEKLHVEIDGLKDLEFDIELTGFSLDEFSRIGQEDENDLLGGEGGDGGSSVGSDLKTKLGDVWLCGKHRIMCGSSTDAGNVATLLDGAVPGIMVTDPPYGVNYDASWRGERLQAAGAYGAVLNDDNADWTEAWALFPGDVAYIWHAGAFSPVVGRSVESVGFVLRNLIIWAKDRLVIGRGNYHHQHEPCWYAVRKGATAKWKGGRKRTTLWRNMGGVLREGEQVFVRWEGEASEMFHAVSGDCSTIWEIPKPQKSETGHSTQKPIECMERPMRNHEIFEVYDPFLGSGTSVIAAERTGRVCYGMELNPEYVDIIVKRWEDFTGKKAELASK